MAVSCRIATRAARSNGAEVLLRVHRQSLCAFAPAKLGRRILSGGAVGTHNGSSRKRRAVIMCMRGGNPETDREPSIIGPALRGVSGCRCLGSGLAGPDGQVADHLFAELKDLDLRPPATWCSHAARRKSNCDIAIWPSPPQAICFATSRSFDRHIDRIWRPPHYDRTATACDLLCVFARGKSKT